MARTRDTHQQQQIAPAVNIAPLGELNAYTVHEHELDQIAEGSPATLAFNAAIALLSIGTALVLTLTTATVANSALNNIYTFICINFILVGGILMVYWWRTRKSVREIVARIKRRMPPPAGLQQPMPPEPPTSAEGSEEAPRQ